MLTPKDDATSPKEAGCPQVVVGGGFRCPHVPSPEVQLLLAAAWISSSTLLEMLCSFWAASAVTCRVTSTTWSTMTLPFL